MANSKRAATYGTFEVEIDDPSGVEEAGTDLTVHFGKPRAELVLHYPNGMRGVYEAPEVDISIDYPPDPSKELMTRGGTEDTRVEFRLYGEWSGVVVAEEQ